MSETKSQETLFDDLMESVKAIRAQIGDRVPTVGLILGSGLGSFADSLEDAVCIEYSEIPHFPSSNVVGHAGRLVIGTLNGVTCVAMQGRVHFYEGHPAWLVAYPARVLVRLGARTLIVTNAAGGLRPEWAPGTLMLIRDHINMQPDNALRGANDDRLGPRFPDMTRTYDPVLAQLVRTQAQKLEIALEEGVYVAMPGPTYETPAEVRMLQRMGADATGMSTVPEATVANHMGAKVIGISCITNKAAGITGEALSHDEVTETAAQVRSTFESLLGAVIAALGVSKGVEP